MAGAGSGRRRQVDEILEADRRESVELDVGPRPPISDFRATREHVARSKSGSIRTTRPPSSRLG